MKKAKSNCMRLTVLSVLLCLCLVLCAGCKPTDQLQPVTPVQNMTDIQAVDLRNTLEVNGVGKVLILPDTATLWVSVHTEMPEEAEAEADASAVQQANAEAVAKVLDAIRAEGIADADIETSNISVNERYDYEKDPPAVIGYEANSTLTLTVRDVDKVGSLITKVVAAGATNVNGPEFSISDSADGYAQALEAALADARAKAESLAAAAGVQLADVPMSIQESGTNRNVETVAYSRDMPAAEAASAEKTLMDAPVSAGQVEVSANVHIVYEILKAE